MAEPLRRLAASEKSFVQLAPVRLLRAVVGTRDDVYIRWVVRSGLLGPICEAFHRSLQPLSLGGGAVVSAVLALLEYIRSARAGNGSPGGQREEGGMTRSLLGTPLPTAE